MAKYQKWGLLLLLLTLVVLSASCSKSPSSLSQQPAMAQGSCLECHSSSEKLKADLEKDPPPETVKSAENEGEG